MLRNPAKPKPRATTTSPIRKLSLLMDEAYQEYTFSPTENNMI